MASPAPEHIFQIKVTLKHSKPPIWRRFFMVSSDTLADLHLTLQIIMGWQDAHLHEFEKDGVRYGLPDQEFNDNVIEEQYVPVFEVLKNEKDKLLYTYDFGDNWEHEVLLEKILPYDGTTILPLCIKGVRACPPEDIGGIPGYQRFLEIMADPEHEEHAEMREWFGIVDDFDATFFDLPDVNALLDEYCRYHGNIDDIAAGPAHASQAVLEPFLHAPQRPQGTLRFHELQGFLFAIACSPELIKPSEWMPMIFNQQHADYATFEEAQTITQALMELYNDTNTQVFDENVRLPDGIEFLSPALDNVGEDAALGQWSRGYCLGHNWLAELWDHYTPDELSEELGGSEMVLSFFSGHKLAEAFYAEVTASRGGSLEDFAEKILSMFFTAMQSYASLGRSIYTVYAQQAQQPLVKANKIGRNDPCPCGSGKKYKKCCLHKEPEQIH